MNYYESADNAIRVMNRQNLKLFGKLKLMKRDELNVIRQVTAVYDESANNARRKYYEIAIEAFTVALYELKVKPAKATRTAEETITNDWILDMLEEVDPVTLYAFYPEKDRKAQRLTEALAVARDRNMEVDKALRFWTMQVGQYADNAVYKARLEAFRAAGVERVRWVTQEDDRVCQHCEPLNGKIFRVEDVPPPQHWGCRCRLEPILQ